MDGTVSPQASIGQAVRKVLTGSWRESPPKMEIDSAEAESAIPQLLRTGSGALAWRQLQHSPLSASSLRLLRESYVGYAVQAAQHEGEIIQTFQILQSAGVDAILIKGWAAARFYPEVGLRPSGDIDLCVPPEQLGTVQSLLTTSDLEKYPIDLEHDEISRFVTFSFAELHAETEVVKLHQTDVRVPGAEDHLRLLCLHLVKHGAWRPLWLCDIAAALEQRPADFDWERCLGPSQRYAQWIRCVMGLAVQLLDADPGDAPQTELPGWLVPAVLKQWSRGYNSKPPAMRDEVRRLRQRSPWSLLKQRWRNPIQATVDAGAPFNNWPRLPYQVRDCVMRTAKFVPQLFRR